MKLTVGDGLAFHAVKRQPEERYPGKFVGKKLSVLPKGTVSLYETTGVREASLLVSAPIPDGRGGGAAGMLGGGLSLLPGDCPFGIRTAERGADNRRQQGPPTVTTNLRAGDLLSYVKCVSKIKEGEAWAGDVRMERFAPSVRAEGTVSVLKEAEGYGFVRVAGRGHDAYVHERAQSAKC